jgi:hypothetical protein
MLVNKGSAIIYISFVEDNFRNKYFNFSLTATA